MSQLSKIRNGAFSSSEIVALTTTDKSGKGFGAPALTYIMETNFERMLDDCVDSDIEAKPLSWGKLCEDFVFSLPEMGLEYTATPDVTDAHEYFGDFWVGSSDGMREIEERSVYDFKCPFTKKSFCQLVLPLYCGLSGMDAMNALRNGFEYNGFKYPKHKDGEKFYQQLVSNSIIKKVDWAELIVFMPYERQCAALKMAADGIPNLYWMNFASENAIPCIKDGGYFKNINIIRFHVPQEDKSFLTECVVKASNMLIPRQAKTE